MKKPNIQQRKCPACHPLATDTLPLINSFVDHTVFYVDDFYDNFYSGQQMPNFGRSQGRSLEDAEGHQHLAGGHRGGCEQMSPILPRGSGVATPGFFLYIFNTKSCILMHSLAPKMDTISVFIKTLCIGGKEDCWKRLPNEAWPKRRKSRPKAEIGVRFLGRGQQAPPARGSGSDVNKTKFLRPRPK